MGQWLSFFDVRDQLLQLLFATVALSFIELPNRGHGCSFQLLQRWPALKKGTSAGRVQIAKPIQRLRKVHLQCRRQLIGQGRPFVDQMAPVFGQQLDTTCQHVIGYPDAQMLPVRHQDLQQQVSIDRVILGPAGIKRFPELG